MPNRSTISFGYRDIAGARHRVLVRQSPAGAWQVLDITVIETLHGDGEGRDAAEAIARDYADQHDHPGARPGRHAAEQRAAA
ncbi:MAG TPA: hypothetical protein VMD79_07795 [Solirubrobacteraceae bacterium]|nr:hypothetical protein [Solirubrobacteraceae bacterium]